jgi:hypothetical protein
MANVLNRTTKQFIASANTVEYPTAEWIINPDMSAVVGQPSKYWTITGDAVTLMNQAERNAVDAAALSASLDAISNEIDTAQSYSRAFAEIVMDEINILRSQHALAPRTLAQLKTALRNKLGA